MENKILKTCVAVPFYNRLDLIQNCISKLEKQIRENVFLLIIDDGSEKKVHETLLKNPILGMQNVIYIQHSQNKGVAVARNTVIDWCRMNSIDVVIMVDCDCAVPLDFVEKHISLHQEYPDVACFGAGIVGVGSGYWGVVDKIMSWAPSIPKGKVRELNNAYYPPAANISFKMNRLPKRDKVFKEGIETGEDVLLTRLLRKNKEKIYFSPDPCVSHFDRDTMRDAIRHAYSWGKHIYFIQMGNNCSSRCFRLWYRAAFIIAFIPSILAFAALGLVFTLKPWLKENPSYIQYSPAIFFLWFIKGLAILDMALHPDKFLYRASTKTQSLSAI